MSLGLLLPAALLALAAWAAPLLIHIARRSETRPAPFAAARWLTAVVRPRRRPRLDELPLLVVRLLLLGLIALGLAQPVLKGLSEARRVVAVMPGVAQAAVRDQLRRGDRVVRLADVQPASQLRQLDAELSARTPLIILAPPVIGGMDAERPRLSRPAVWRVVAGAPMRSSPPVPATRLTVRHDAAHAEAVRYIRAATTAWTEPGQSPAIDVGPIDRAVPDDDSVGIWLAASAPSAAALKRVREGGVMVIGADTPVPAGLGAAAPVWRDEVGRPLATASALGRGRLIRFTEPLEPRAQPQLLEPDFPDALSRMVAPPPPPTVAAAQAVAPLTGAAAFDAAPIDLRPWLAILVVLAFAVERWLATRRARGPTP